MPPFIDPVHLHQAIVKQAIPVLEAVAVNDNLRSRRFERDGPPSYASSTESEEFDHVDIVPLPRGGPMPDDLKALMERPFSQDELQSLSYDMRVLARPDDVYYVEAKRLGYKIDRHPYHGPRPQMFRGLDGCRREGVIVRHLVKRRWEKLGLWNPQWGFAGRKLKPSDDYSRWTWWWQPEGSADDWDGAHKPAHELVTRAIQLRQNLRRGEHVPVIPRSHLGPDATAAEAEAFLISRPWFTFRLELAEESARYRRLSVKDQRRFRHSPQNQVIEWWKQRGDWTDEFDSTRSVVSWKWRHESPSPEPEDIAPFLELGDTPLHAAEHLEFTPSEIDELETINLPRSQQPKGFWVVHSQYPKNKSFPGEIIDLAAEADERDAKRKAEGEELPVDPVVQRCFEKCFPKGATSFFAPVVEPEATEELPADVTQPREETSSPPQERRRLRQRRQPPQDEVHNVQDENQAVPSQPRRSARIAAMKRPAESSQTQTRPKKRAKRATPKPAPAGPTRRTQVKDRAEGPPKRGRGRPRKN